MRGVVTGGAGFVGSHVADVLAGAGHEVTIVDLAESPTHRTIIADIGDLDAVSTSFEGADFVCHLAAVGDVYVAAERPWQAAQINVTGTANACAAALRCDIPVFVYASTWEVYGEPRYQPIDEDHPCAPDHPYSITKLAGERLALAMSTGTPMRLVALRLGTAYGIRMRANSVFAAFIDRARRGEPLRVHGDGMQARQFTHARDIGRAFELAVRRPVAGVYNTVASEPVTIIDLAQRIARDLGATVEHGPARPLDVAPALVSSARIREDLGWRAEIPFEEGLTDLVRSHDSAALRH